MIYDVTSDTFARARDYYTPPGTKSSDPSKKKGGRTFEPAAHVVS